MRFALTVLTVLQGRHLGYQLDFSSVGYKQLWRRNSPQREKTEASTGPTLLQPRHTPRSEGWARVPSYRAREAGPAEQKRRVDTVSLCCSRIKHEAGERWELRMKTWTGFGSWGPFRSCEELELCPRCPLGAASAPRHLPAPWHQGLRLTPQAPSRQISPWGEKACNTHQVQRMDFRGLTRGWTDCPITVDFPSSPVVKNLPANAGDPGLIPGPGRFHVL